jgi:hypothetical protein
VKSFFSKIWNDSVWSKVIAGAILSAIFFVWNKLSTTTFNTFIDWLSTTYPVPNWTVILLILFILFCFLKKSSSFFPPRKAHIAPEENRALIEKAIYEKREITGFNLVWTGISNDNNFLEFCLNDFSETWLIQEIQDAILTNDIKRQIRIVNRHLAEKEARHEKVIIILLVYRMLPIKSKTDLYNQLLLFNSTENLNQKISFQVWDKSDIDKILNI